MKIVDFMEQRLVIGFTPTQSVETDTTIGKADLATHQSMRPVLGDRVGPAEKVDGTVLIAAPDEDDRPFQRRVQIERETLRKRASRVSAVTAVRGFVSVGRDIGRRYALKRGDMAAVMPLPDLALPQGIEAFDGVLQSRLAQIGRAHV